MDLVGLVTAVIEPRDQRQLREWFWLDDLRIRDDPVVESRGEGAGELGTLGGFWRPCQDAKEERVD